MTRFYDSPTDTESMLPEDPDQGLAGLGWEIVRRAERLGAGLHPLTAGGQARVVQVMNSEFRLSPAGGVLLMTLCPGIPKPDRKRCQIHPGRRQHPHPRHEGGSP